MMERTVLSSRKGFTLVETLIAMMIILIVLLGMVQATFLSIDSNLKNLLRDEAVRIAEEQMNMMKGLPITEVAYPGGLGATADTALNPVTRYFGSFNATYQVHFSIIDLSGDIRRKSIQVYVGWHYKRELPAAQLQPPTNEEYQYMISALVVNPA